MFLSMARELVIEGKAGNALGRVIEVWTLKQNDDVTPGEFVVSALCYLPVLRRYFVIRSGSAELGLARFETVEAVVLPFFNQLVGGVLETMQASLPGPVDFRALLLTPDPTMEGAALSHVTTTADASAWEPEEATRRVKGAFPRPSADV